MAQITSQVPYVAKNLVVPIGGRSYKAASETDIISTIKPLEFEYRIYSFPISRKIIETGIIENKSDYKQNYMRLEIGYRFINIDKPEEYLDIISYGDGIDSGDKAPGKAMTYADKYALMKAYKIPTGEDPDKDASLDLTDKVIIKKPSDTHLVTKSDIELINEIRLGGDAGKFDDWLIKTYGVKTIPELAHDQGVDLLLRYQKKQEPKAFKTQI
jgi:hypothetical protein